ncbi:hypothetical protein QJR26_14725 [Clostridium baratii]
MENNIKSEFKEFINVLSKEICKEVLLEDMKTINTSFNTTVNECKGINEEYNKNLKEVEKELNNIITTRKDLNIFIKESRRNNEKLDHSLNEVNIKNEKIRNSIINENNRIFNDYIKKIKTLNEEEKFKLITEIKKAIEVESKKYILNLKSELTNVKVLEILEDLQNEAFKTKKANNKLEETINKLDISCKSISEVNNKIGAHTQKLEKNILNNFNKVISSTNTSVSEGIIKLVEKNEKSYKKINEGFNLLNKNTNNISDSIDTINKTIKAENSFINREINGHVDTIHKRLDAIEKINNENKKMICNSINNYEKVYDKLKVLQEDINKKSEMYNKSLIVIAIILIIILLFK